MEKALYKLNTLLLLKLRPMEFVFQL